MSLFEPQSNDLRSFFRSLLLTTAKGAINNWAGISFSLVVAFIIWVVVQDYENPRIRSLVPAEGEPPVIVLPLNVPDGLIVEDLPSVRVLIEARQETINEIRAADFTAEVNAVSVAPGHSISLAVEVKTNVKGVRILKVEPESVVIPVSEVGVREMPIVVRTIGELPSGYVWIGEEVEPSLVTVRGLPFLVEGIDRIEATISLSGLRDTVVFDRELVAVTKGGNRVSVSIDPSRVSVRLKIAERTMQRSLPITVNVTGEPKKGFAVEGIAFLPPTITISGDKNNLLNIDNVEVLPIDITNASGSITVIRNINLDSELSSEIDSVVVVVTIVPLSGSRTLIVAPEFIDLPTGLTVANANYGVQLKVEGPASLLNSLNEKEILVYVSLENGSAGYGRYPVTVYVPDGLSADAPKNIFISLEKEINSDN
tara:strand:+ start:1969 stop:3246 length:1278 start_codon:yes stop_codon:yes gene_type:complete